MIPCLVIAAALLGQPVLVVYSPLPSITVQPILVPAVPIMPLQPAQAGRKVWI